MKAFVLRRTGVRLEPADLPVPAIGPTEVLVETRTCGICRTDLHIQDGLAYVPALPHVPGHEPAGVVAAVGGEVAGLRPGQRVVPHLFVACGRCRYCVEGRQAQCLAVAGIIGVTLPGGFAEYFAAPARNLVPIPDGVGFDAAGLVSCAVITAVHAWRRASVSPGQTAVVLGAGGIGLILVQILRHAGLRVAALSRSETSLSLALQQGAELAVSLAAPDAAAQVRGFAGGDGAACAFDLVGRAATAKLAAACVERGGRVVIVGEEAEFPAIDTIAIAQRELEIVGSRNGGLQDAVEGLGLLAGGIVRPVIDRRYPLDELNEGLDYVRRGQAHGRVVVEIGG
jgi:propanol-preferring alcohol dehydrogenase